MPLHDKYRSQLEDAQQFEDHVERQLYQAGLPIGVHHSRHFQVRYGESRAGVEIKFDRMFRDTGNLFIETAERHHRDAELKPAGIYGKGCMIAIGDYQRFWLFCMKTLRHLHKAHEKGGPRYSRKETVTAEGFLLPVADASRFATLVIEAEIAEEAQP